jgi:uncharacterized membrane protein
MRGGREDWIGRRDAFRAQREALAEALTAEPFEIEAVEAAMTRERELGAELVRRGGDLLLAQIARMSPEERAAYAAALLEDRRGGTRRHERD